MSFVHLHVHTEFSLLDGVSKIKPLVKKVKELGMNSIAITDHGVMYGAFDFWQACQNEGIKPIIGCEVYVANRSRFEKDSNLDKERYHLTLLAKTLEGYKNLVKIVSLAHIEGYYYKPRIDEALLKEYGKGIIALSGCISSKFNRLLGENKTAEAKTWLMYLQDCVDDLYVEVQRNGIPESENLIPLQLQIASELNLKVVATCDAHYINKPDNTLQEILWCISDGVKLDDPTRRAYGSQEFYIKTPQQMADLFADIPEAVINTQVLADSVENYSIKFDRIQPKYATALSVAETAQLLKDKTYAGAALRYSEITPEIKNRIDYELEIIGNKGYNDYFLVVQDYIDWARTQGIMVGPGRGSGAGSVVAYCLKITNLCPFTYDLIFERFLNPERPSPPDFDIDFQDNRRDELFVYMMEKYGKDHTAFIGTFGKLQTRAAIRDIARVMGIELQLADKLSKLVETKFGKVFSIDDMLSMEGEFKEVVDDNPGLQTLVDYVRKLAGNARHVSIHASGFIVTPEPIVNYVPLQLESRGSNKIITQYEMVATEEIGLMKFDFLGLANLTIIQNTLAQIKANQGLVIDIDAIPLDDQKSYQIFQEGKTTAIFQFESDGMKRYLKDLVPNNIEDLIFMAAAYRPGPMEFIPSYINRKFGKEAVSYPDESLKNILDKTFGIIIYQEQILNTAVQYAGYTQGAADMLRRAMGKKKVELMAQERSKFVTKAVELGHAEQKATEVFDVMEKFANYGFNRSHSAAYAIIAYQTAYLKANYTIEFLAGLLEADLGKSDKLHRDLDEARELGVTILPPSVNDSNFEFTIVNNKTIRFGLGGIKGTSSKVMTAIMQNRISQGSYNSLDDLIARVGIDQISKKDLELLAMCGAMDEFGARNSLLAIIPTVYDQISKQSWQASTGQTNLFGESTANLATNLPELNPLPSAQLVAWEKELLGVFLSRHPLAEFSWAYLLKEITPLSKLNSIKVGNKIKVLAVIEDHKVIRSKKNNRSMSFLTISDSSERCEAVLFPNVYDQFGSKIADAKPTIIAGVVSEREGVKSIMVDVILEPENLIKPERIRIDISNVTSDQELESLGLAFSDEGDTQVDLWYNSQSSEKKYTKRFLNSKNTNAVIKLRSYLV